MSAPGFYEIRVGVHLDDGSWSYWFPGFAVREETNGETVLTGPAIDQAALHGVLTKIRDLNLELISVNRLKRQRALGKTIHRPLVPTGEEPRNKKRRTPRKGSP